MDGPSTFGELLRRHRLSAGLTQEALAQEAGLSARGSADLERGVRRCPYPDTVDRLAAAPHLDAHERSRLLSMRRRGGPVDAPHVVFAGDTIPLVGRRAEWRQLQAAWQGRQRGCAAVRRARTRSRHRQDPPKTLPQLV